MAVTRPTIDARLRPISKRHGLELAVGCGGQPGIGDVITVPQSPKLVRGVVVAPLAIWPDDRGYFLEVLRSGRGIAEGVPVETIQVSASLSYPGTIKAIHYHCRQTDIWATIHGMLQVMLCDLRVGSPTFGVRNTLYVGEQRAWALRIPPGVGHGYKVLGTGPAVLVYATDRFYDPEDEGRLPFNDPDINYDWETQHK